MIQLVGVNGLVVAVAFDRNMILIINIEGLPKPAVISQDNLTVFVIQQF